MILYIPSGPRAAGTGAASKECRRARAPGEGCETRQAGERGVRDCFSAQAAGRLSDKSFMPSAIPIQRRLLAKAAVSKGVPTKVQDT